MAIKYPPDVVPLLLTHCPGARTLWDEHAGSEQADIGLYIDFDPFGEFARRALVDGDPDALRQLFVAIEVLLVDGDQHVRDATVVGFMEGLQNASGWAHIDPDRFRPFLGPESLTAWDALNEAHGGTGYAPAAPRRRAREILVAVLIVAGVLAIVAFLLIISFSFARGMGLASVA